LDYEAKILLEVVPWVDAKLSRGWTVENRKFVINQCKLALAQKLANSDDFCICIEEKIQKNYKFLNFRICSPSNRPRCIRIMEKAVLVKRAFLREMMHRNAIKDTDKFHGIA
jgi:hypothetical protein